MLTLAVVVGSIPPYGNFFPNCSKFAFSIFLCYYNYIKKYWRENMIKKNQPIFEWDEESGKALCILTDGNDTFIGTASCAEADEDMKSEKTGCTIALYRAEIQYYRHIRDHILKPSLGALNQLYYSINKSKRFNEKSYENKMLCRQISQKETDLDTINEMITTTQQNLKTYLDEKEKLFKRLRYLKEVRNKQ
jgi:hypothetical protein